MEGKRRKEGGGGGGGEVFDSLVSPLGPSPSF